MKIAVILTCHNRKAKTLSCLDSLFLSRDKYNEPAEEKIELSVFLTDDGCTDGTIDAVRTNFSSEDITILQGDGNLFWAKGMIAAWEAAMAHSKDWRFYLLVNDDTIMLPNLFDELISTHKFCLNTYQRAGIYSGVTCTMDDSTKMSYGGDLWVDGKYSKHIRLLPTGIPQMCDMTNANILMIDKGVVNEIGIFYPYRHGRADNDYTIQARKYGIPVLITGHFCGKCDNDHNSVLRTRQEFVKMTLKQRMQYFKSPLHSTADTLTFTRRNMPSRYLFVLIGRMIDLFFPRIYTLFLKIRGQID